MFGVFFEHEDRVKNAYQYIISNHIASKYVQELCHYRNQKNVYIKKKCPRMRTSKETLYKA